MPDTQPYPPEQPTWRRNMPIPTRNVRGTTTKQTRKAANSLLRGREAGPMKRIIAVVAIGATLLVGCGGGGSNARAKALDRRERALDAREKQLDERETALNAAAAATTTASPDTYPREVQVSTIKSQFVRDYFQRDGDTTAVAVGPGVYARKGQGPVGDLSLYTSVVGETCADVQRYTAEHQVSSSC